VDGGREALAVPTGDHRLVVLEWGVPEPLADIYVGADIQRVAPVDDRLIGVAASSGLVMLELPPRP
jgi:hypothetical protein